MTTKQWGTATDVAEFLSISTATVWRWNKIGLIPQPKKIGKSTRWSMAEIAKTIENAGGITEEASERARVKGRLGRGKIGMNATG